MTIKQHDERTIAEVNNIELIQIAAEREEWAKDARDKDMFGTAMEWEFTAKLAREIVAFREKCEACPECAANADHGAEHD